MMAGEAWDELKIRREIQRLVASDEPARAVEAKLGALRALLRDGRQADPVGPDASGDPMADLDPPRAEAALLRRAHAVLPSGPERDRWMRRYDRGVDMPRSLRGLAARTSGSPQFGQAVRLTVLSFAKVPGAVAG